MSASVALGSKLPGDEEINGLDHMADELCLGPQTIRAALVLFDVGKITHDPDSGAHVPTIRIRRFEPLGDTGDVPAAVQKAVGEAFEKRTGRKPIPFGVVEVSTSADPYGDELPEGD